MTQIYYDGRDVTDIRFSRVRGVAAFAPGEAQPVDFHEGWQLKAQRQGTPVTYPASLVADSLWPDGSVKRALVDARVHVVPETVAFDVERTGKSPVPVPIHPALLEWLSRDKIGFVMEVTDGRGRNYRGELRPKSGFDSILPPNSPTWTTTVLGATLTAVDPPTPEDPIEDFLRGYLFVDLAHGELTYRADAVIANDWTGSGRNDSQFTEPVRIRSARLYVRGIYPWNYWADEQKVPTPTWMHDGAVVTLLNEETQLGNGENLYAPLQLLFDSPEVSIEERGVAIQAALQSMQAPVFFLPTYEDCRRTRAIGLHGGPGPRRVIATQAQQMGDQFFTDWITRTWSQGQFGPNGTWGQIVNGAQTGTPFNTFSPGTRTLLSQSSKSLRYDWMSAARECSARGHMAAPHDGATFNLKAQPKRVPGQIAGSGRTPWNWFGYLDIEHPFQFEGAYLMACLGAPYFRWSLAGRAEEALYQWNHTIWAQVNYAMPTRSEAWYLDCLMKAFDVTQNGRYLDAARARAKRLRAWMHLDGTNMACVGYQNPHQNAFGDRIDWEAGWQVGCFLGNMVALHDLTGRTDPDVTAATEMAAAILMNYFWEAGEFAAGHPGGWNYFAPVRDRRSGSRLVPRREVPTFETVNSHGQRRAVTCSYKPGVDPGFYGLGVTVFLRVHREDPFPSIDPDVIRRMELAVLALHDSNNAPYEPSYLLGNKWWEVSRDSLAPTYPVPFLHTSSQDPE